MFIEFVVFFWPNKNKSCC